MRLLLANIPKLRPAISLFFHVLQKHAKRPHPEFAQLIIIQRFVDHHVFQSFAMLGNAQHPVLLAFKMFINACFELFVI